MGYVTKGRRDKRLPLIEGVHRLLTGRQGSSGGGLLFLRPDVMSGTGKAPLRNASRTELRREYADRLARERQPSARIRQQIRNTLFREAGGLRYDHIEHEFRRIKTGLNWPDAATLKDFRHLFSTCLQNAGLPESYRKYLTGHAPGRSAMVSYSHLNQLRERYDEAVQRQLQPLVAVLAQRSGAGN